MYGNYILRAKSFIKKGELINLIDLYNQFRNLKDMDLPLV